jgi:hypothetical protein
MANANVGAQELTGVVGYLKSGDVSQLVATAGTQGTVDVRFEPGNENILMRLRTEDITSITPGSLTGGDTRLHILMRPGAVIETVVKMFRDVQAIEDPTFSRLSALSHVSVSFV